MSQPTGAITPINFGYRVGMFGWDDEPATYLDATCYTLTRLQESNHYYGKKGTYGVRPYHAHQGYVEDETPNLSCEVRYVCDDQTEKLFVFGENCGDDYGTRTFNRDTPPYPYGIGLNHQAFQESFHPRFYCLEIRAHSTNPDPANDDHILLRGGIVEHRLDTLAGFETKAYTCYRGGTVAQRIYGPYHFFSAYHARCLLSKTYNRLMETANLYISYPLYSAEDPGFRPVL